MAHAPSPRHVFPWRHGGAGRGHRPRASHARQHQIAPVAGKGRVGPRTVGPFRENLHREAIDQMVMALAAYRNNSPNSTGLSTTTSGVTSFRVCGAKPYVTPHVHIPALRPVSTSIWGSAKHRGR